MTTCCGMELPEGVGKHGCPNCNGDNSDTLERAYKDGVKAGKICSFENPPFDT